MEVFLIAIVEKKRYSPLSYSVQPSPVWRALKRTGEQKKEMPIANIELDMKLMQEGVRSNK